MSRKTAIVARTAMSLLLLAAGLAVADDYTLDWYTFDGGGAMWTTEPSAEFELSGTIGQPDAGVVMTGGDFELVGGFWLVAAAPQWQPGDLNCDGLVNNFDITPFVRALTATPPDYPEYYALYPDCDHMNGDINGDGALNNFDITPFVHLLTGG